MKELKAAFPKSIPVLFGYVFLGMTYGVLMTTHGFPIWLPILTAAIIYTGSMEFLMTDILLSSFNPLSAFVTALMIGARHIFYGLSMLKKYHGKGLMKFYLIYTTSDETFAVNYDVTVPKDLNDTRFYFFVSLLDQSYWIIGCALGAIFGSLITFNTDGLSFVMTAMFVSIFMSQWLKDGDTLKKKGHYTWKDYLLAHASELIGIFSSVVCLIIFGPDLFIVPTMILILVLLTVGRKKLEVPEA